MHRRKSTNTLTKQQLHVILHSKEGAAAFFTVSAAGLLISPGRIAWRLISLDVTVQECSIFVHSESILAWNFEAY